MRKLLIILFLLILALPVQSATMVSGRPCPGGAGSACSTSTDYVGSKADLSAENLRLTANYVWCLPFQATTASCSSGTLGKFYVAHNGTGTENIKGAIFTDSTSGTGAPNGETLIGNWSAETTCSTDTATPTCTEGTNLTGTVSKDGYYFICVVTDDTKFDIHRTTSSTKTQYYKTIWTYASPPDVLTATGWTDTASREWGAYVEIY
jgi:hypothetical protein